jgi:hypothetical protein
MDKPVWEKPNPVKKSTKLSPMQKAKARARARAAGRPYPNMVDNIWAARSANEEFELKRLGSNPGKFKRLVAKHLGAKAADKIDGADGSRIMAMAKRKGDTALFRKGSFIKNFYGESYEEGSKEIRVAYARMTPGQTPFVIGLDKDVPQDNARELRRRRAKKIFKAYFDEGVYTKTDTDTLKQMHARDTASISRLPKNAKYSHANATIDREYEIRRELSKRGHAVDRPSHRLVIEANEGKTLGKPFRTPGERKKFGVYVRNDSGNVVKVRFGDPNLSIKRDSPARRKSFRARHNCANPGPRTKARYWSCRQWRASAKVEA